jgi:hypothetical protein
VYGSPEMGIGTTAKRLPSSLAETMTGLTFDG